MVREQSAVQAGRRGLRCDLRRSVRLRALGKVTTTYRLAIIRADGGAEFDCSSCTLDGRNTSMGCSGLPKRNPLPVEHPTFPMGWQSPMWSMLHSGFADRPDLSSAPIERCPAMQADSDALEYVMVFADSEAGATLARHLWSPAFRDVHRTLRVEKRLVERAVHAQRNER